MDGFEKGSDGIGMRFEIGMGMGMGMKIRRLEWTMSDGEGCSGWVECWRECGA